jgi:hypothetical protein
MITGAPSGPRTRLPVSISRLFEKGTVWRSGYRRTRKNTTMQRPTAISSAGTTEAANSAPVDTAASPAKMTAGMLGGMTGAIREAAPVTPSAKLWG